MSSSRAVWFHLLGGKGKGRAGGVRDTALWGHTGGDTVRRLREVTWGVTTGDGSVR